MENLVVKKAEKIDIDTIFKLINGLAEYEKRPEDMTGTKEELSFWLFEKKIATTLLASIEGKTIGYAIYYPIFGSFSARGKVHLEDMFILKDFRGKGLGKKFFAKIAEFVSNDGYTGMEWSALDWNESAIKFYEKIGAEQETGRVYFELTNNAMKSLLPHK